MAVKLFQPYVSWYAIFNVVKVLLGTQLAEGPLVKKFEHDFGTKFGLHNVVAVNSGTTALELAYELADIGYGDEVITTVLTCTATNIPLVRRGANIVFADIAYDLNMDVEDVKRKITPQTKAIVFVHFGGNNRGLRELLKLCETHGIALIEDAAQAVGSPYWGKADYTAVSLQAIKTLTSGDGGFLICKDQDDYEKAKRLRWFGYDRDKKHREGDINLKEAGYKYHMNDITAAIGLGNLKVFDKIMAHKRALARIYASYGLTPHVWLCVGYTRDLPQKVSVLKEKGIEIGQHHYRNDQYSLFERFKSPCPTIDRLEKSYYFVPNHYGITKRQAHEIGKLCI